jgi:hypothetical protein
MVKQVVILDDVATSKLAREIARDIRPLKEILRQFNLTEDSFEKVIEGKFFQVRLAEETHLWNASDPLTIRGRVEVKTATMIEDMLLEAYTLFHDRNQPMAAKIELLKWAARIAGMGENANGGVRGSNSDSQVKITINIAGHNLEFDKERKLPERVIDGTVVDLTPEKV